jgi:hypothetical protein
MSLSNVLAHEASVEVGTKKVVYKLLLLALFLCAASLVLENHIIVPAALHVEILLVKERVSKGNVSFSSIFFFFESLCLLHCVLAKPVQY